MRKAAHLWKSTEPLDASHASSMVAEHPVGKSQSERHCETHQGLYALHEGRQSSTRCVTVYATEANPIQPQGTWRRLFRQVFVLSMDFGGTDAMRTMMQSSLRSEWVHTLDCNYHAPAVDARTSSSVRDGLSPNRHRTQLVRQARAGFAGQTSDGAVAGPSAHRDLAGPTIVQSLLNAPMTALTTPPRNFGSLMV